MLCTLNQYLLISLCNLCVSVVCLLEIINHRDTENTEVHREERSQFLCKASPRMRAVGVGV